MNRHAFIGGLLWLLGACSGAVAAGLEANSASAADLDAIKGIGPATSARIVSVRQARPFADWQDFIDRVPGIGPATAHKLSAHGLTVNRTRYQAGASVLPDGSTLWVPMTPRPLNAPR